MPNLGILSLPGRGHLYPAAPVARALDKRGYRVTIFSRRIASALVKGEQSRFCALETGTTRQLPMRGNNASRPRRRSVTIEAIYETSKLLLQNGRELLASHQIDGLLVDQAVLAGGTIADALQMPFVTISFFPPVFISEDDPPFFCHWAPGDEALTPNNIQRANQLLLDCIGPILEMINTYRVGWSLPAIEHINDTFSKRGIVSQLPELLDFPRKLPSGIYHTAAFSKAWDRPSDEMPWHLVCKGKPLVYASMGTVRNYSKRIFEVVASACSGLDIQLVVSLGGMELSPADFKERWPNIIFLHYARQLEVLEKASLTICHGGLNTVLESIAKGVPLIALPVGDDQPGVGARVEWSGIGRMILARKASAGNLREAIKEVLSNARYQQTVRKMQIKLNEISGADRAADIIENLLWN